MVPVLSLLLLSGCRHWTVGQSETEASWTCTATGGRWSTSPRHRTPTPTVVPGRFYGSCRGSYLSGVGTGDISLEIDHGRVTSFFLHRGGPEQVDALMADMRDRYGEPEAVYRSSFRDGGCTPERGLTHQWTVGYLHPQVIDVTLTNEQRDGVYAGLRVTVRKP